jgi:hypothetical protein
MKILSLNRLPLISQNGKEMYGMCSSIENGQEKLNGTVMPITGLGKSDCLTSNLVTM